jgi:hypothetical protein
MTKITLAKKTVRDFKDPIIAAKAERKHWKHLSREGL